MNKLVSRNPVLRFKLGRKIVKAFNGTVFPININGENVEFNPYSPLDSIRLNDYWKAFNDLYERAEYNGEKYYRKKGSHTTWKNSKGLNVDLTPKSQKLKQSVLLLTVTQDQPPQQLVATKNWNTEYNNFLNTLTNDLKTWLDLNNVDYSSADKLQKYLMDKLNTTLGGYKNDGKWGRNSNSAWNTFVSTYMKNNPVLPTSELLLSLVPQNTSTVETPYTDGTNTILNQLAMMQNIPQTGEDILQKQSDMIQKLPFTSKYRTLNPLNRSDTRWIINDVLGKNAYNFTGDLRKALRQYLNGEEYNANDLTAFGDLNAFSRYKYKNGGNIMNTLPSRNIVERFKQGKKIIFAQKGISFKDAWNQARSKKLRYFNWTDTKGRTRMYNSKAAGNDAEYLSFIDNMNEMSAQLPKTDNVPLHLGWEITKNKTSTELRNNDKFLPSRGTDTTIGEIVVTGNNKSLNKPKQKSNKVSDRIKIKDVVYSRGIASGVPLNGSLNGIFILGNSIFRKRLVNGLYVIEPIGKVYNGQQYYDERIFGLPNLYSTSFDNDGILRYDEYSRLSGMNKNKFLGRDSFTGNATAEVKTLPTIEYMIQNVPWYQNTDRIIHRRKSGGLIKKGQKGLIADIANVVYPILGPSIGIKKLLHSFYPNKNILPEVVVTGTKPYTFDRRYINLENGRKIISDVLYDEYDDNGNYLGDYSPILGSRIIYSSPEKNDTLYGRPANGGTSYNLIPDEEGYVHVPVNALLDGLYKTLFYLKVKNSHVRPNSDISTYSAYKRALKGK